MAQAGNSKAPASRKSQTPSSAPAPGTTSSVDGSSSSSGSNGNGAGPEEAPGLTDGDCRHCGADHRSCPVTIGCCIWGDTAVIAPNLANRVRCKCQTTLYAAWFAASSKAWLAFCEIPVIPLEH